VSRPTNNDEDHRVKVVPDLSIGLASRQDNEENKPEWAQFQRHLLSRALLHPNYGLIADPYWGETDLLFPFVVYEAKKFRKRNAWKDPAKDAINQASDAAKIFLKMQATLAHRPGPAHTHREPSSESETSSCVQNGTYT